MSNLELNGTITVISDVQTGTAKSTGNTWKKCGFVVETKGEYPKSVYFTVFGEEKVDNLLKFNKVGQDVDVSFNVESREYNGKYYTDLQAWKIFGSGGEKKAETTSGKPDDGFHKGSDLPF
jgi:hypothetical protein|tara:strand:- start:414 stop:776 length:363 start_codon:yes stop_codon:yes gene_type:complete